MADFNRDVYCVLGLPFDAINMADAVSRIRSSAAERKSCVAATPNVNFLAMSLSDSGFRDAVIRCDLSLMDGMPLVWIARLLRVPIRERVSGSNLFEKLRQTLGNPLSVFFFGGPAGVAEAACHRLRAEASGLTCAGFLTPGYVSIEEMSNCEMISKINASKADFLIVSLGARKGLAWIERNRRQLDVPVISHLGAVVNFVAGTVSRAPGWMQRRGIEWLWRIKEEPELWRRYALDAWVLLRLLFTRILPLAWHLRCNSPRTVELARAGFETALNPQFYTLHLRGAWHSSNLKPLRAAFFDAVKVPRDVELDMAEASYVDTAFIGLVLLLSASLKQNHKRLHASNVQLGVRRMFRYCLAEHILLSK